MTKKFTIGLLATVCLAATAFAQGDWYRDRMDRFRDEHWKAHIFGSVRNDLEHIYSAFHASDKERRRLDRTRQELGDLQDQVDHDHWNNGEVNDVIDSLRKSADDQRLAPRDRDVLADDLHRIQDYQNEHNHFRR